MGKKLNKFKIWNLKDRKKKILTKGDCKIKHVFSHKDLIKAGFSRDLDRKFQCLRCKTWISTGAILKYAMDKEGIDMKDKQSLFDKYNGEFYSDPTNESKKDNK